MSDLTLEPDGEAGALCTGAVAVTVAVADGSGVGGAVAVDVGCVVAGDCGAGAAAGTESELHAAATMAIDNTDTSVGNKLRRNLMASPSKESWAWGPTPPVPVVVP